MAKNKKKTPLKKNDNLTVKTTPSSAQKQPIDDVPPTDLLSLRLVQASATSSSSKRVDAKPHASLSEQDAAALDVLQDEDVILLATTNPNNSLEDTDITTITGVAICKVDIGSSMRTPSRSDGKRSIISPGSIRISP
jgi:hypothetical protein